MDGSRVFWMTLFWMTLPFSGCIKFYPNTAKFDEFG